MVRVSLPSTYFLSAIWICLALTSRAFAETPDPPSEPTDPDVTEPDNPAQKAYQRPAPAGYLAEGTRWATPYYRIGGTSAGPTVFVTGGVHGDEPAGPAAADELLCFPVQRGTLVVIPRANLPAVEANRRRAKNTRYPDLNRNFPKDPDDAPRGTMARALWKAVENSKPDLLIDLHEGFDFNRQNRRSVGNTVLYYPSPENRLLALRMVVAVNTTISVPGQRFRPGGLPILGSLARSASEIFGIDAMITETTKRKQPLGLRVQQQLIMVARALSDRGMLQSPDGTTVSDGALAARTVGVRGNRVVLPLGCSELDALAMRASRE